MKYVVWPNLINNQRAKFEVHNLSASRLTNGQLVSIIDDKTDIVALDFAKEKLTKILKLIL